MTAKSFQRLPAIATLMAGGFLIAAGCRPVPSAAQVLPRTNHLAGESSPYLRLHAGNPVDWYPWGDAALERARRENRPIFLSIGYAACHWCHVMERESFRDPAVAELLNREFVAIKVDREERPDVDGVYMTAVQLIAGSGGWPLTAFLLPDGRPFHGGTYFRRDDLLELLREVAAQWKDDKGRARVEAQAARVTDVVGKASAVAPIRADLKPTLAAAGARSYLDQLDRKYGGFASRPKFPPALRLRLMLAVHRHQPDKRLLDAVMLTLDKMALGGVFDQVGGGFHRYSTDEMWLVPHFEKMLYDNAQLAIVYLDAYELTGKPQYRHIAVRTLDFVLREMRDGAGGFWSSLNAESPDPGGEHAEGSFYVWRPPSVVEVLGAADGNLFSRVYGVTPLGNFEGASVPHLVEPLERTAVALKLPVDELESRLDRCRRKLLAARERRARPTVDDKVIASWNGLMVEALIRGFEATGAETYRRAAEKCADFLCTRMRDDQGRVRHTWREGRLQPQSFLEDYAAVSAGLSELHRVTGEARWLDEATRFSERIVADFWEEKEGVFFATPIGQAAPLARMSNVDDEAVPSPSAQAALALLRQARHPSSPRNGLIVQRLLGTHAGMLKRFPAAVPALLYATHLYFTADATPTDTHVVATLEELPATLPAEGPFTATLRLKIEPGWHINPRQAGKDLVPTEVRIGPGNYRLEAATFPPAPLLPPGEGEKGQRGYQGEIRIALRLKAVRGPEKRDPLKLRDPPKLLVRWQACGNGLCLPPVEVTVTAPGK